MERKKEREKERKGAREVVVAPGHDEWGTGARLGSADTGAPPFCGPLWALCSLVN